MALRAENVGVSEAISPDDAFERLFIYEYRRVVAIAQRIVNDADEAEDVAQEVFASFHRRHDATAFFAPAWLHRAAAHIALNAVRTRRRRSRREHADAASGARAAEGNDNPVFLLERQEQRLLVRRILERLPARSARILALRHSGLSYAEVAAAMRCGVGDVGTMLRRAEAAFRKEFEHETSQ